VKACSSAFSKFKFFAFFPRESEEERATERQNIEKEKEAARRLLIRLQVREL